MPPADGDRSEILVGTCGFAGSQERAFTDLDLVEIQQTFYEPPRVATAARWRARAPGDFRFTLKAWQLITHPASSPTYRRLRTPLTPAQRVQCGGFRWNDTTRMAWTRTLEIAETLDAEVVVFQTPARFRPTPENLDRLHGFFGRIERHGRLLAFEPRGEAWTDDLLEPILDRLDLIHATDPFLRAPLGRGLRYFRLHGRPAYHYHHRYTEGELEQLRQWVDAPGRYRILFNNDAMAEDSRRFRRLLERRDPSSGESGS